MADLDVNNVGDEAPIIHVEKFKMDYHVDDGNPFDYKTLDATFNSRKEAYEMLEI